MGILTIDSHSSKEEEVNKLSKMAIVYIDSSIADSTRLSYNSGLKNYVGFCEKLNLVAFPLHQSNVILFATELAKTNSLSAINIQLAGIKFTAHKYGYSEDFSQFRRLYSLLRGIKRSHGLTIRKKKRAPITPVMLREMNLHLFNSSRNYHDKQMLWAAMLCAFFGFLRVSEYTSPNAKTFNNNTLCHDDVVFNVTGTQCCLRLKGSKTDPFRVGVNIRLSSNGSSLCPLQALKNYLMSRPAVKGPLFVFQNGSYLTRQSFSRVLKTVLTNSEGISTHSFRIGAATTAAAMGFPRWLIKSLGRWSSDCFRDYIRVPDNTIEAVSKSLVLGPDHGLTFDPDLA